MIMLKDTVANHRVQLTPVSIFSDSLLASDHQIIKRDNGSTISMYMYSIVMVSFIGYSL